MDYDHIKYLFQDLNAFDPRAIAPIRNTKNNI